MNEADIDEIIEEQENEQIVEQPNITFVIDGKIMSNIFGFLIGINSEVPMKFEENRILMHLKSVDNIQYAQVEINASDLLDYNPMLEYGSTEKNILVDTIKTRLEKIDKIIDITTNILDQDINIHDHYSNYVHNKYENPNANTNVIVKVFNNKIEFHLPGNVIIWADLINDKEDIEKTMKAIDKLPDLIKKVRNNSAITKSSATIQPMWLDRICNIKDVEKYESAFRLNISKKEGFNLISRSRDGFYELKLKPRCIYVEHNRDEEAHVYIDKELIMPITKIEGSAPVIIEIRTDKPIIFERKLSGGINAMLTIAPRIPVELKEEEKGAKDIDTLVLAHSLKMVETTQEKKVPEVMDL